MMLFKIQNGEISKVLTFLQEVKLSGRASRGRTRLSKMLEDKIDILSQYQEEMIKKYVQLENGQPKVNDEQTSFVYNSKEDAIAYTTEFTELLTDTAAVDMSEYEAEMNSLLNGLLDSEQELNGEEALIYDLLCSQLEDMVS